MRSRLNLVVALSSVLVIAAACSGGQPTTAPTQAVTPTQAATAGRPAATQGPTQAPATTAAEVTVNAEEVGDAGTIIVDGATDMTLYYFEMDKKDSGKSNCNEGCIAAWPALTVEAGETPTGGTGVDATKLGTITRDDGDTQVTYDGLPVYFFANDEKPGDLKGVYTNWIVVPA